jgi:tRNA/rRNA methyltransferase
MLTRVCCVLIGTSHPGNVGAAARAMKTMGLVDLRLVAPQDAAVCRHPEAVALSSGATDVLERAQVVATLEDALADTTWAVAVSAEPREFGPPPQDPDQCAAEIAAVLRAHAHHRVALIFGPERTGLSIMAVQACQRLVSIPASPVYASLNLAQAVMVLAYAMRRAALAQSTTAVAPSVLAPTEEAVLHLADHRALHGFFEHLERSLRTIGFLDPAHPKKLMPRLRRLFLRSHLRVEEVNLLRGVCKQIEQCGSAQGRPSLGKS